MSKELKIGLIAIFLIALLIWGINFLKGKNLFSQTDHYYALYDEVGGMEEASSVYLNGYKIGMVENINLTGHNNRKIIVKFSIRQKVKIPVNSRAVLYSDDLMGTKALRMEITGAEKYYSPGDTIPSLYKKNITDQLYTEIQPLKTKTENLLSTIDSVLQVFDQGTRNNVRNSFDNLSKTTDNLSSTSQKIDYLLAKNTEKLSRIIENTDSVTTEISNKRTAISQSLDNIAAISDSLKKANLTSTLNNLQKTLTATQSILNNIDEGKGSAGQLLHNDSLYHNLNKTTMNLNKLIKDIEENPGRYINVSVFGKNK